MHKVKHIIHTYKQTLIYILNDDHAFDFYCNMLVAKIWNNFNKNEIKLVLFLCLIAFIFS